jgi:hypothetical protein
MDIQQEEKAKGPSLAAAKKAQEKESEESSTTSDSSTSTDSDETSSSEESDELDFIADKRGMYLPQKPRQAALLYANDPYHLNQQKSNSPPTHARTMDESSDVQPPRFRHYDWRAWQNEAKLKNVSEYRMRYDQEKVCDVYVYVCICVMCVCVCDVHACIPLLAFASVITCYSLLHARA